MIKSISIKRLLLAGLFILCAASNTQAVNFVFGGMAYDLHITRAGLVRYGNNHATGNAALDAAFLAAHGPAVVPAAPLAAPVPAIHVVPQNQLRNFIRRFVISAAATGTLYHLVPTLVNRFYIAPNLSQTVQNSAELMSQLTYHPLSIKAMALISGIVAAGWHLISR